MSIWVSVFYRYVAPFFVGVLMAATTVVSDVVSIVVLFSLAGALGYCSLPAGGRMIARLTNAAV
jgi:hypothetical protein